MLSLPDRIITSLLGSTVPSLMFFIGRFSGGDVPFFADLWWSIACAVAWLASIWMTSKSDTPCHRYECFFTAMGFPAVVLSGAVLASSVH